MYWPTIVEFYGPVKIWLEKSEFRQVWSESQIVAKLPRSETRVSERVLINHQDKDVYIGQNICFKKKIFSSNNQEIILKIEDGKAKHADFQ